MIKIKDTVQGKRDKIMSILGALCLFYWVLDFTNLVLILHRPTWLLWYSSLGLLSTGIALVSGNIVLIYSAFCALFLVESMWSIDFLYVLIVHKSLFGFTNYAFDSTFSKRDFYMTLYHFLIPVSLFYAVIKQKKVFRYGWLGATLFVTTIITLTYFLAPPTDIVNCVHIISHCQKVVPAIFKEKQPLGYFLAILTIVFAVYVPSNFIVLRLKKNHS